MTTQVSHTKDSKQNHSLQAVWLLCCLSLISSYSNAVCSSKYKLIKINISDKIYLNNLDRQELREYIMNSEHISKSQVENVWRTYMTTGEVPEDVPSFWYHSKSLKYLARMLPSDPRCAVCYYPFSGLGGTLTRSLFGLERSKMNPRLCNVCEKFAVTYQGGAEIEISMLFADVRGSTGLAEGMSAIEFSRLIDRFYAVATRALYNRYAFVENLAGDGVAGFFTPGFAGEHHAQAAIETGEEILRATGHADRAGPWIPVGVGVHTGIAYVGSVNRGSGAADISVLGDTVNVAARISSQAAAGEMLVSSSAISGMVAERESWSKKHLELKGRQEPIDVWGMKISG